MFKISKRDIFLAKGKLVYYYLYLIYEKIEDGKGRGIKQFEAEYISEHMQEYIFSTKCVLLKVMSRNYTSA